MLRRPVDSSLIRAVGYDLASSILEVELAATGRVYRYFDLPLSVYSELMEAESKGAYFNDFIRDLYPFEEVAEGRYPAVIDAGQILAFVLDRIAQVGRRPLMYGGNAEEVNLLFYAYFDLWAEIVGRRDEYDSARFAVYEEAEAGSASFAIRYREGHPGDAENEVTDHVVRQWMTIAERCGLDVPPIPDDASQD
jgi:hypothetical protein